MNAQTSPRGSNVVVGLVHEAFIESLQEMEPMLSPTARTKKAARLVAALTAEETLDIFMNYTQR